MFRKILITTLALAFSTTALGEADEASDAEELKISALEALMSAPPDRALPIVTKVLQGDHSDEVKENALFVLSQIDRPEAYAILIDFAKTGDGDLQYEAIRMVGINGNKEALATLKEVYDGGDENIREAVLEAYLISDDTASVYEIAANAQSDQEFEDAVDVLGMMGARDELRQLRGRGGNCEYLIDALSIADDDETLKELASDTSNRECQLHAIEGLGIIGGADIGITLVQIYKDTSDAEVREAALDGMLIGDYDEAVLELYQSSTNAAEKRELLEYLVMMDSEAVWDVVDDAFEGTL